MSGEGQPTAKARPGGGERRKAGRNVARLHLRAGGLRRDATVRVTACGLLAIGGVVSSILLSTAVLVGVATATTARMRRR